WSYLRPKLLDAVHQARDRRLEAEAKARREAHLDAVHQAFGQLWNRFSPRDILLLPTREQLLEFEAVAQLAQQPSPAPDAMDEYCTAVRATAESVVDLVQKTLLEDRRLLHSELRKDVPFPTIPSLVAKSIGTDADVDANLSLLNLAVSAFHSRCPDGMYRRVQDANQVLVDMRSKTNFFAKPQAYWSRPAANVAMMILRQLELPLTTTAAELDRTNLRVVCEMCGKSMTWRAAMDHVCQHHKMTSPDCLMIQVLNRQTLTFMNAFVRQKRLNTEEYWGCLRCEPCGPETVWRDSVAMTEHLRDEHSVNGVPMEGVDFYLDTRADSSLLGRIIFPMKH
ncbi:hypothetical protein OF83DRAFT_1178625, partial [Amylostereum chailletii]